MNGSKYGKYILTEQKLPQNLQEMMLDPRREKEVPRILYLDDKIIPGAFYLSAGWWLKPSGPRDRTASPQSRL